MNRSAAGAESNPRPPLTHPRPSLRGMTDAAPTRRKIRPEAVWAEARKAWEGGGDGAVGGAAI